MKKLKILLMIIFCFSLLGIAANVFAVDLAGKELDITLTQSYVSRYIWRGQDLYGQNDPALQPSVDLTAPELFLNTDLGINIWGSFPLNAGHQDAEELDYTLSFSRDILDDAFSICAGYTYFDYPNSNQRADVQEPWLSVTLNRIPLLPIEISANVFAGYDFQAASGGPDEGWYYSWGFSTQVPLPKYIFTQQEQTLSLGLTNWGNDGVADLEPCGLYASEFSISTSYNFANFSITPSFNYTLNHEDQINNGDDEIWAGIAVSRAF